MISSINSTLVALGGAATFTGGWEECDGFASITINAAADVAGTLYADFSDDGSTTRRAVTLSTGDDGVFGIHTLVPVSRYFRVRVINGAGAQASLYVESMLHREPMVAMPTSRLGQAVTQFSPVLNVRNATDVDLDTAVGTIGGRSGERKFGSNDDVGTGAQEDIWIVGGAYPFPSTALAVRVKVGGNAADDTAGANAQEVTVVGLDENWAVATEAIATAGASASSATTTTFIRIHRAYVSGTGTYGATNLADIDIETTGGTTLCRLAAGFGQTQLAIASVPAGKTAYIRRIHVKVNSGKTATVYLWRRDDADVVIAPMGAKRLMWDFLDAPGGVHDERWMSLEPVGEKSDFWFSSIANTSAAQVSCQCDYTLVDNA